MITGGVSMRAAPPLSARMHIQYVSDTVPYASNTFRYAF